MWHLERTQGFSNILLSDLVFDLPWPIFKLVQDFIRINISTKFYDYQTQNVALERTKGEKLTTHDGRHTNWHSTITIAHTEHFVLRWAKKYWSPSFSTFPTLLSKVVFITVIKINPFPNKPWFLRVCSTCLLKTLWEKEKLLVTSNFSFSHSVFYLYEELFFHFRQIWNCRLQTLSVWKSRKFVIWERVKDCKVKA